MDPQVAVAAVSAPAARAGLRAAGRGGNAVDAALAAGLTATVTHPGMCSLGGAAFVTVWPAEGDPAVIDGAIETPGRGLDPDRRGRAGIEVRMGYGGGTETVVGPGSIGTPGSGRIPTVVHQVLLNRIRLGMTLEEAVRHPRLHVEAGGGDPRVACEPGLPTHDVALPVRRYDDLAMYFGGAAVAERDAGGRLLAAADPRRGSGTGVGPEG